MSCSYADGLSPYDNKGKLGLKEIFDSSEVVKNKVKTLAGWIEEAKHVVLHTGAGISTSAGIPDFRGPKGVWTLEAKGEKPNIDISFDDAAPTLTHMAILKLVKAGLVHYVVSQNIDGLHLKSGLSRDHLSELHGNMYIEECKMCNRQFVMETATKSVGQKCLGRQCPSNQKRPCRGKTHDTILDWEADLPEKDLDLAYFHSTVADLNICLGTTLQITPSGNLPLSGKKKQADSKLVICNLQPTKHDRKADLIINTYVDDMMSLLMGFLDLKIDPYLPENNPVKFNKNINWTISKKLMKEINGRYKQLLKDCKTNSPVKRKPKESEKETKVFKKTKTEGKGSSEFDDLPIKKETLVKAEIKNEIISGDELEKNNGDELSPHSSTADRVSPLNIDRNDVNGRIASDEFEKMNRNGTGTLCDDGTNNDESEHVTSDIDVNVDNNVTDDKEKNPNSGEETEGEISDKAKEDNEIDSGFSETPDEG